MKESQNDKDQIAKMAELIRKNSADSRITVPANFREKPLCLAEQEIKDKLEELRKNENYKDIKVLKGSAGIYLFSENKMTIQYAQTMARIEDKDILTLIAENVRDDSRIYPRPTKAAVFYNNPFNISEEVFKDVLEKMKEDPKFKDIKKLEASNGVPYLYSQKYLEDDHAIALTEWVEVIQKEVP